MKKLVSMAVLLAFAMTPLAALAQDEDAPRRFVYGTYFECDPTEEWMADGIVELVYKPIYDKAVEDGALVAWGWMAHHTGGKWRRLLYRVSPSLDAALGTLETLGKAVAESNRKAAEQVGKVCSSHEDYIWEATGGTSGAAGVGAERGEAGMSVYYVCDIAGEDRADEIVSEVYGPIYDRHVEAGDLVSWGWLEHIVGGKWRRIATMTGADHASILATRGAIIQEIREKHPDAGKEFSSICSSHQDYLWDIQQETP